MYGRKGSLFMLNFKRKSVLDNNYFTQLIVYIHKNPVHHGFCKDLIDWPHSSLQSYILEKPTKLNRKYLEEWFGNKERLLEFHRNLDINNTDFEL
jgi:putative transposase